MHLKAMYVRLPMWIIIIIIIIESNRNLSKTSNALTNIIIMSHRQAKYRIFTKNPQKSGTSAMLLLCPQCDQHSARGKITKNELDYLFFSFIDVANESGKCRAPNERATTPHFWNENNQDFLCVCVCCFFFFCRSFILLFECFFVYCNWWNLVPLVFPMKRWQ